MKVLFFCPYWGAEDLSYPVFFEKIKRAGYDGAEMIVPHEEAQKRLILQCAKDLGLEIIGLWGGPIAGSFKENLSEYEKQIRNAATIRPKFVTAQTGKDCFTFEQNLAFLDLAENVSKETGTAIVHEMHRGKFAYAPFVTRNYLEHRPQTRLVADLSHWCNVCESFLEDQEEDVQLALRHSDHIHARVGFPEGPQIPDPRTPEWKPAVDMHASWWDRILQLKLAEGASEFTITPEFGPFPYMPMMPFTGQPITSQWEVNLYMKDFLTERYAKLK